MSADNGIYIAKFPTKQCGEEYRVTHATAIENVDYDEYVRDYFENEPTFDTLTEALEYASALETKILADDFCPILEYGVCVLQPFPKPLEDYPVRQEE